MKMLVAFATYVLASAYIATHVDPIDAMLIVLMLTIGLVMYLGMEMDS